MELLNTIKRLPIIKLVMIALLIFVIYNQVKIVKTIIERSDALDADPLVVAAKRYDIDTCTCFLSPSVSIEFNKNNSKKIIKHIASNPFENIKFEVNLSESS